MIQETSFLKNWRFVILQFVLEKYKNFMIIFFILFQDINVCTHTTHFFNDCGAFTACVDIVGGSVNFDGKTCRCISDSYKYVQNSMTECECNFFFLRIY